ncbi:MAG TPA: hypothetical protein VGR21_07325, partial [Cryptosporangiaceae bacterium]|nr:hypothetical protein [Cryptosporangiaceae bacterium]
MSRPVNGRGTGSVTDDRFGILFVCTANLCRSPMAEHLARQRLSTAAPADRIVMGSGGTRADAGRSMHPHAAAVLSERGVDPAGFVSRPVSATGLLGASLVLTAAREHRAHCVTVAPGVVRRCFTLAQFVRLAESVDPASLSGIDPADRPRAAVAAALSAR